MYLFRQTSECYMCNGFYGPSFGEPVCATCHAFLFPEYALIHLPFPAMTEVSFFSLLISKYLNELILEKR